MKNKILYKIVITNENLNEEEYKEVQTKLSKEIMYITREHSSGSISDKNECVITIYNE